MLERIYDYTLAPSATYINKARVEMQPLGDPAVTEGGRRRGTCDQQDSEHHHRAQQRNPRPVVMPPREHLLEDVVLRAVGEDGPLVVCVKVVKGRAEGKLDRDVVGHSRRFAQALAALPVA